MDKSWMRIKNRVYSKEYADGVDSFIKFALEHLGPVNEIWCPCVDCRNGRRLSIEGVKHHLIRRGMSSTYETWVCHGETGANVRQPHVSHEGDHNDGDGDPAHGMGVDDSENGDELFEMLHDVYRGILCDDDDDYEKLPDSFQSFEREEILKFCKFVNDGQQPLHIGCTNATVLSFVVKMLHAKVYNKWTNASFDMVMGIIKDLQLEWDNSVPWTLYEAKKFLRGLGLGYEIIHACKYDCALFWGDNEKLENCPICKEPRYKLNDSNGKKIPHKVLRHFPLIPRLKRLFMSEKTSADMRWHKDKRVDDKVLRHPGDGEEWKIFDLNFPDFASEARNVRLGLATDGFNPFGNMSTSYSTWPIVVMPYNLPPWKCMKEPYCMMTLLIPRPHAPGKDIDVYMRPLIDELNELWEKGVVTYDASSKRAFSMHAAVLWTINDFPAYGNLSGWTTKGYLACPICNEDASSQKLHSKIGYVGARRFLPRNHPWRTCLDFNGEIEDRLRPSELTGEQVLEQIQTGTYKQFGKHPANRKKRDENPTLNWVKLPIMYELPYWKTLKLRHNLDVMHIEKNICDNLLGTLLGIDGKNKDTEKARLDLQKMNIRPELHLKRRDDGYFDKPLAAYTLPKEDRQAFCDFIKSIKYPDGYAANISNCVNAQGGKLTGLKSHDCHVLLQQILPIGMRGYLEEGLLTPLSELGQFFRQLCSKTLKVDDLEKLEEQIVRVLCKLEGIFPPAFFDVMVHLAIHLPREAKLGGPVQFRWMYPIERYFLEIFLGSWKQILLVSKKFR